jgi:DNA polymerase-3 subunit gamma/tau
VGKTTIARILAKSLNCETGVSARPCGQCSACTEIDSGRFVDLIEVDAASRTKVEDTRDLLEIVQYAPTRGRYKVYLIDEVHMLSAHSFNALLKTLEEPPPHVKFLLATTDPQRLPVTILSRCLQFSLKRLPVDLIKNHLEHILAEEQITAESPAVLQIARAADGSMRDALSLLDQAIAYGGDGLREDDVRAMLGTINRRFVVDLTKALAGGEPVDVMAAITSLAEQTPDYDSVLGELISMLHQVALAQMVPGALDELAEDRDDILRLAETMSPEDVQLYYQVGLVGRRDLLLSPDARSGFEMTLLRMLAFRPAGAAGQGATRQQARPASTSSASQSVAAPVSVARARPAAPAVADAPDSASPVAANPGTGAWSDIVAQLKVSGLVQQLATNCALREATDSQISLVISPLHASLRNEKLEARLEKALQAYYGKAVKLTIDIEESDVATPAVERAEAEQNKLQSARREIEMDQNVQSLMETFDGKIVPDSVQPLD